MKCFSLLWAQMLLLQQALRREHDRLHLQKSSHSSVAAFRRPNRAWLACRDGHSASCQCIRLGATGSRIMGVSKRAQRWTFSCLITSEHLDVLCSSVLILRTAACSQSGTQTLVCHARSCLAVRAAPSTTASTMEMELATIRCACCFT